jgi:hypothetical protein
MNKILQLSKKIFTWSIVAPLIAWLLLCGMQLGIKEALGY